MDSKWFEHKAYLEKAILVDKKSYEEIGREFDCSGANIKKVAARIGIKLPQRRIINPQETFEKPKKLHTCLNCGKEFEHICGYSNKYCCSQCEKEHKHQQKYKLLLEGDPSIMRANYNISHFKDDIIKEQGGVCDICKMPPEWNGKKLVFIVDHIDGHASNNKRENLRCICPNCDSQLDTYKFKNKCSDRHYYRYHKEKVEDNADYADDAE